MGTIPEEIKVGLVINNFLRRGNEIASYLARIIYDPNFVNQCCHHFTLKSAKGIRQEKALEALRQEIESKLKGKASLTGDWQEKKRVTEENILNGNISICWLKSEVEIILRELNSFDVANYLLESEKAAGENICHNFLSRL